MIARTIRTPLAAIRTVLFGTRSARVRSCPHMFRAQASFETRSHEATKLRKVRNQFPIFFQLRGFVASCFNIRGRGRVWNTYGTRYRESALLSDRRIDVRDLHVRHPDLRRCEPLQRRSASDAPSAVPATTGDSTFVLPDGVRTTRESRAPISLICEPDARPLRAARPRARAPSELRDRRACARARPCAPRR